MRTRYTRLTDLQRLFNEHITASTIAEPLATFDVEARPERVRQFLDQKRYDVVGVRDEGLFVGYIDREQLGASTSLQGFQPFSGDEVLEAESPLVKVLEILTEKPRVFVLFLGEVSGIITRSDLQKQVVRMWLFCLISMVEIRLLSLIRNLYPDDLWKAPLEEKRLMDAERILQERIKGNEEIDLPTCLQFCDKREILRANEQTRDITGMSKRQFDVQLKRMERIRNNIAHSQTIPYNDWSNLHETAKQAEKLVSSIDNYLTGDMQVLAR